MKSDMCMNGSGGSSKYTCNGGGTVTYSSYQTAGCNTTSTFSYQLPLNVCPSSYEGSYYYTCSSEKDMKNTIKGMNGVSFR